MKYDFSNHSLYNEEFYYLESVFSLYIDTLEMIFDYSSGKLIGVQGFFPLLKATRIEIDFPIFIDGMYRVPRYDELEIAEYMAYDFDVICKESAKYFSPLTISYDSMKGLIIIGSINISEDVAIRIRSDTFCFFDDNNNLKGLCISID